MLNTVEKGFSILRKARKKHPLGLGNPHAEVICTGDRDR